MSIIYGYYSITVKIYTPLQLEAEHLLSEKASIEVLQKMGHLFFIPCFPMEKLFVFRQEGKTYALPFEIERKIKEREVIPTPFYSYALPLLIVMGMILWIISSWLHQHNKTQLHKQHFSSSLTEMEYALAHLNQHHFIKIDNPAEYGSFDAVYLNFIQQQGDSIQFHAAIKPSQSGREMPYQLAAHFYENHDKMRTVTIHASALSQALPRDFKKFKKKIRPAIPLLGDNRPYFIESIQYIDGPEIVRRGGSGFLSSSQIQYTLENIGSGATLTEVRNLSGPLDWAMKNYGFVPGGYSKDNRINLQGDGPARDQSYSYLMILTDTLGMEHQFEVNGKNFDVAVKRLY